MTRDVTVAQTGLAVVEAAYRVHESIDDWTHGVARAAQPALDQGMGVLGLRFRITDANRLHIARPLSRVGSTPPEYHEFYSSAAETLDPTWVEGAWGCALALDTGSAVFARVAPGLDFAAAQVMDDHRSAGVRDNLVAKMLDADGTGFMLCAPMPRAGPPDVRQEARWRMVMTHVLAGLRLHRALVESTTEAVLNPGGRVVHAEAEARTCDAREALRNAAIAIDRARSRSGRRDPDAALQAWRGLVSGRWSLIDRFDSDGRRFLVARRNDPILSRPRALSDRQRQVAAYAALGHTNKRIAYALGLAPSTVSTHLRTAMERLGVRTTAQLRDLLQRPQAAVPEPTSATSNPELRPSSKK